MLRSDQILSTVEMIQKENLDVRTVTMGINLLDCRGGSVEETCANIENKITSYAGNFVATCNDIGRNLGIEVVNKRSGEDFTGDDANLLSILATLAGSALHYAATSIEAEERQAGDQ